MTNRTWNSIQSKKCRSFHAHGRRVLPSNRLNRLPTLDDAVVDQLLEEFKRHKQKSNGGSTPVAKRRWLKWRT